MNGVLEFHLLVAQEIVDYLRFSPISSILDHFNCSQISFVSADLFLQPRFQVLFPGLGAGRASQGKRAGNEEP